MGPSEPLSWPEAPQSDFPLAIGLLTGRFLLPSQRTSQVWTPHFFYERSLTYKFCQTFQLPPLFQIILDESEHSALVFACHTHNGMAAHAEIVRHRYQEALRNTINIKLQAKRADATCRNTQYRLELWITSILKKLSATNTIFDGPAELRRALDSVAHLTSPIGEVSSSLVNALLHVLTNVV